MRRMIGTMIVTTLFCGLASMARAEDEAMGVVDKAIQALGGAEKLSAVKCVTWKSKVKLSFGGSDNDLTVEATAQGLNHYRQAFAGDFQGNKIQGVVVVAGDKGWRKIGDMETDLDADGLANEKRNIYLGLVPITLMPLKDKSFKVQAAKDEKVGDKMASAVKVIGPDGKDFTLLFDKETNLPVKLTGKVVGFDGSEFTQETYYTDYKEVAGIKKAMKVENKRDGEKFMDVEITEFKAPENVDASVFTQPK